MHGKGWQKRKKKENKEKQNSIMMAIVVGTLSSIFPVEPAVLEIVFKKLANEKKMKKKNHRKPSKISNYEK